MTLLYWIALAVLVLLAVLTGRRVWRPLRERRPLRALVRAPLPLLFLSLAALLAVVRVSLHGYEALVREEVAATVDVEVRGPQRFTATFRQAGGETRSFELTGDRLFAEAHIVKWHPLANLLGLHTAYRLVRVGGRYDSIDDERGQPRAVHELTRPPLIDAFALASRVPTALPLVDAQYGSASFVPADDGARYELRVSTSGLLFRER